MVCVAAVDPAALSQQDQTIARQIHLPIQLGVLSYLNFVSEFGKLLLLLLEALRKELLWVLCSFCRRVVELREL